MAEFRVIFVASDYDATVGFFTDVMGLEVERSFGEIFRGTILLAAAGRIEVIEDGAGWDTPGVSGVSVSWQIADADAEHARLVSAGATILRPPDPSLAGWRGFGDSRRPLTWGFVSRGSASAGICRGDI